MAQKILLKKKERNTKDFWLGGARRESQNRSSLAEGTNLTDTLISDFWPPVSLCHVKPPSVVVICYGSPRNHCRMGKELGMTIKSTAKCPLGRSHPPTYQIHSFSLKQPVAVSSLKLRILYSKSDLNAAPLAPRT